MIEKKFVRCIDEDVYNITAGKRYELLSEKKRPRKYTGNASIFYLIKDDLWEKQRLPASIIPKVWLKRKKKDTQ